MKNALALTLLSVVVSQVMAVVPIPIKECTKTVVVDPKYDACTDFARDYNITFKDLLQYNEKLRKDCMNLDTGEKMCVSINPGGVNPPLVPKAKKEKTAPAADADSSPKEAMDDKKTKEGKAAGETAKPELVQDVKSAPQVTEKKENTPAAAVAPPAPANAANGATPPPTKQRQQQPNTVVNGASISVGATSSMLLAAAGVLLSVVYVL
ncbi:hypothetical protein BGZ91_001291 [Linnemannia elongata]|nr:hypothetical protein BGZ91_001291 [Linnemannia elongata]KAG0075671.1 hypothetical protein BGZ90_009627 [Linnemannia elongata]